MYAMVLIMGFLAPLPRVMIETDVTDAELIAHVWDMSWGCTRQTCYFWHDGQDVYNSPQFGGGSFVVGKGGRVEFEEGSNRYVMTLRRTPEGLVGTGCRIWDDGTRGGEVSVTMKHKRIEMD